MRSGGSKSRTAYVMSILLGRGVVERIASGLYWVKGDRKGEVGGDTKSNPNPNYWDIIACLIRIHTPSGGII
jgi:hypothetical protein